MAAFVRGKNAANIDSDYLMLVWSMDSGKGDGGISFWNWSQPDIWSAPTRAFRLVAPQLREAHSTPVTNMFYSHRAAVRYGRRPSRGARRCCRAGSGD